MITNRRILRPNLTPMIDVVFLLLLFFVLSTQFSNSAVVNVDIAVETGASNSDLDFLLLEFGDGGILSNGKAVELSELEKMIANGGQEIALRPDEAVNVESLLAFQNALYDMGALRIVLVEKK